jgi:hypothetical protein
MIKHNASVLGFSKCHESKLGRPVVGGPILVSLSEARTVTLRHGGISVLVESIVLQASGTFIGRIRGFEQSIGPGPNGMVAGDSIEFEWAHIFGAVL